MDGGKLRRFGIKKGDKVIEATDVIGLPYKIFKTKLGHNRV